MALVAAGPAQAEVLDPAQAASRRRLLVAAFAAMLASFAGLGLWVAAPAPAPPASNATGNAGRYSP